MYKLVRWDKNPPTLKPDRRERVAALFAKEKLMPWQSIRPQAIRLESPLRELTLSTCKHQCLLDTIKRGAEAEATPNNLCGFYSDYSSAQVRQTLLQ